MHFKHKCFMRCLTCFLGKWLSTPVKWMTIFNLLDDASLRMTILVLSSFLSPGDMNTYVKSYANVTIIMFTVATQPMTN